MKFSTNTILILLLTTSNFAKAQTTICDLCEKMMGITQERRTENAYSKVGILLESLTEKVASGKSSKEEDAALEFITGGGYFDGSGSYKSTKEEYNMYKEQNKLEFNQENKKFLNEVFVNVRGWESIDNCIKQCPNGYKKSIITYKILDNDEFEVRIYVRGDKTRKNITLTDFEVRNADRIKGDLENNANLSNGGAYRATFKKRVACSPVTITYKFDYEDEFTDLTIPIQELPKVRPASFSEITISFPVDDIKKGNTYFERTAPALGGNIQFYVENNRLWASFYIYLEEFENDNSKKVGYRTIPLCSAPDGYDIKIHKPNDGKNLEHV